MLIFFLRRTCWNSLIYFFGIFHTVQIDFGAPSHKTITLSRKPMNFDWRSTHFSFEFNKHHKYSIYFRWIAWKMHMLITNIIVFVGSVTFVIKYARMSLHWSRCQNCCKCHVQIYSTFGIGHPIKDGAHFSFAFFSQTENDEITSNFYFNRISI